MSEYTDASQPRPRRLVRWPFVLLLLLAVGVAAVAYAGPLPFRRISQTLSSVRNTSLDTALETKVRGALALSRRVSGFKVGVQAHSGRVTLAGRVPSQEARSILEAIVADALLNGGLIFGIANVGTPCIGGDCSSSLWFATGACISICGELFAIR